MKIFRIALAIVFFYSLQAFAEEKKTYKVAVLQYMQETCTFCPGGDTQIADRTRRVPCVAGEDLIKSGGFVGGFVTLNSGDISNEGSTVGQAVASPLKGKEAMIVTFWNSFEDHERSHQSDTFQPLFMNVLELCENGNEEIAYDMLWSGKAYSPEEARKAREVKQLYSAA